jgi:spore germination protein (amino acid permease)
MQPKEIISHRQLAWIVGSLLSGGGIVSLHSELIRLSGMDAWFCNTLAVVYSFVISFFFGYLSEHYPGKNLFEIVFDIAGKWGGGILNLFFLVHMWLILVRDVRGYAKYLGTVLLPNTPEEVLVLVMGVLLIYFGNFNVEVISRTNEVFFPIFFIMVVLMPIMLWNEIDFRHVEPLLVSPLPNIMAGNALTVGWYGELFVTGAFLHAVMNSRQVKASLRHGTVIGTVLLTVFLVLEVLVLGTKFPAISLYTRYSLAQQIHITEFLDRVDLILVSLWFFIETVKILIIDLAFLLCIGSYVGRRHSKLFNKPGAILIIITAMFAFKSTANMFSFGIYGSAAIGVAYQPLLIAVIWLLVARKRRGRFSGRPALDRDRSATGAQSERAHPAGGAHADSSGVVPGDLNRRSAAEPRREPAARPNRYERRSGFRRQVNSMLNGWALKSELRTWNRRTNLLLLAMIILIALGLALSPHYSLIGLLCGIGFALALILMLLTTAMELFRTGDNRQ